MDYVGNTQQVAGLGSLKDAVVSMLSSVKEWTVWMGHKVINFAGLTWDIAKAGLLQLVALTAMVWKSSLPYIARFAALLGSNPGWFAMGLLASLVVLRMALNDDNLTDATGRHFLTHIGSMMLFFTGVYGAQAEFSFIPQLVRKV
jgi:hypothetical protein